MAAFRWAKSQTLPPREKFILVMIGDHYNDDTRRSWPAVATLARETGLSIRTVQRGVKDLELAGLVAIEVWYSNNGGDRLANRYCLPKHDPKSIPSSVPIYAERGPGGRLVDTEAT